jgi:hypothetical protein
MYNPFDFSLTNEWKELYNKGTPEQRMEFLKKWSQDNQIKEKIRLKEMKNKITELQDQLTEQPYNFQLRSELTYWKMKHLLEKN